MEATPFSRWLDITMTNERIKGRTLARELQVHESAVSKWRSGTGVPAMAHCLRLAQLLGVEPIRLAVTAGLVDRKLAGIEPLAPPEPRIPVRDQIREIKGLSRCERRALLETYEALKERTHV